MTLHYLSSMEKKKETDNEFCFCTVKESRLRLMAEKEKRYKMH